VSGSDWMLASVYIAALMGGTMLMSVLARRSLSKLKARGH
jgi:hypothetical protein